MKKFLKSPLNYTGGKHKLLPQILPLFPKKIETFVDLFAGGCNVAVNVDAKRVIANDIDANIIALYDYFQKNKLKNIVSNIEQIIQKFGLSQSSKYGYEKYNTDSSKGLGAFNKKQYEVLRASYNANKTPLMFYVTLIFAFNNQIRFNSKGEFNMPVNKRDFNNNMKRNLCKFIEKIQNIDISFSALDYREVFISDDAFVYIDPPYLATVASYNENGGWSDAKEREFLDFMDRLDARGIKFALSNVFENKGKSNELLVAWSKKYRVHHLHYTYHNCNYQAKDKSKNSTQEVLIVNY